MRWETVTKDKETKEVLERVVNNVYKIGNISIYESEVLESSLEIATTPETEDGPKLVVLSEMTKPEFRAAIVRALGLSSVDEDILEYSVKKSIRIMRSTLGGLSYTQEFVNKSAKFYQEKIGK